MPEVTIVEGLPPEEMRGGKSKEIYEGLQVCSRHPNRWHRIEVPFSNTTSAKKSLEKLKEENEPPRVDVGSWDECWDIAVRWQQLEPDVRKAFVFARFVPPSQR